jgi:hypothetical protein
LTEPANESKPKPKKQPKNKTERNSAQTTAFLLSDKNFSNQKIKTKYPQMEENIRLKFPKEISNGKENHKKSCNDMFLLFV